MLLQMQVFPSPPTLPVIQIFQEIVLPVLGMGLAAFLGWGVLRYLGRRARPPELEALQDEVARLRDQVTDTAEVAGRIQDLEERLDFAERVLTQQRERGRLGAAGK
jgi:hypothetical protein